MTTKLTAEELTALAKKHVDRDELRRLLKDDIFREFARIFHFMCVGSVLGPDREPSTFGHYFVMKNPAGDLVELMVDISIKATSRKKQ